MTGLKFELNDTADQWLCKGLRIDRHGIHFGASKGVTWEALDKLRAIVGGQYPVACTHPNGHWFGSYGMGKCERCGLSQLEVYGPAQMAEWKQQQEEQELFDKQVDVILQHLLAGWWEIVKAGSGYRLVPTTGYLPPVTRTANVSCVMYDGRFIHSVSVSTTLIEDHKHLLEWGPPPRQVFRFGTEPRDPRVLPPQPTTERQASQPNWFQRLFQ